MAEDSKIDLDDLDIQAEIERRYNIYYRLIEAKDVSFSAQDFFLLEGAFDHLTDEESEKLGMASLNIETVGREGLDFPEVTEHEREFAAIIKRGVERYKREGTITSDDLPDGIIWTDDGVVVEEPDP